MLLNEYLRDRFGHKVYKVAINGGFTCPNRDGTLDSRGCIFCSGRGSGEFSCDSSVSVTDQIENGIKRIEKKLPSGEVGYIAYFQAFTNTYAPVSKLERLYMEAISDPRIEVLSVATRPDCISNEALKLLEEINKVKPVWVELGLQTIHEKSASYIRRGYKLPVYDEAVKRLSNSGIEVITHVILGLPGETHDEMLETVRVFFFFFLNLTAASKQLFIHRNTLNYRLDKIKKETGLDLRSFEDAVIFRIVSAFPQSDSTELP